MVNEIIILQEGGILLFHYSIGGTKKLDELVAAFLSAVDSLAAQAGRKRITTIAFASNKLVWEKKGNLFFIAMVAEDSSSELYRIILKDLAEQFVSMFYADLMKELNDLRRFKSFTDAVEETLHKFDGIPGLARRYKTILLPSEDLNLLKKKLVEVEISQDILRGCLITYDGYIAISHLRAYEIEIVLDLMPILLRDVEIREHASLEKETALLFVKIQNKAIAAFVVHIGLSDDAYRELVTPFVIYARDADFGASRKFEPEKLESQISFYDFDRIKPIANIDSIEHELNQLLSSSSERVRSGAFKLRDMLKENPLVSEIEETMEMPKNELDELLAKLIAKNLIRIVKAYPILEQHDERFVAFLEVIGIKKKDFNVVKTISTYCDGSLSIQEISERTNIPAVRVMEVLHLLSNNVSWSNERVLKNVR
ncbi:MAG: hypothetical protein ACFFDV_10475 [Candidatus Thorarchaeota archaeon]